VFEGNTGDPKTLSAQIDKLKRRFKLKRVVLVGDRGMITSARIEEELKPAGLDWITSLRAPQIKALVADGPLQLSIFDERDLAEITAPDYPGERVIVCRNAELAKERKRKRAELLRGDGAQPSPPCEIRAPRTDQTQRGDDWAEDWQSDQQTQNGQALHARHSRRSFLLRTQ
jgi:hypothetical protein